MASEPHRKASLGLQAGRAWSGIVRAWSLGWAVLLATAACQAAPATEVLVTTARFGDMEFDWGRDGVFCGECNGGDGNARFNWVDRQNRLWISYIDHDTGFFYPPNGRAVLVDTDAAYYSDYGNGPEWAFSQLGSQLVYTRYESGVPYSDETTGIALAKQVNGTWTATFVDDKRGRISPGPSQSIDDPYPLMVNASSTGPRVYWRELGDPVGQPESAPWLSVGLSVRWIPNSRRLAFVNGAAHPDGRRYQQVFTFDADTNVVEQITFDATQKRGVFMFPAPEFGGDMTFFTVADRTELRVYSFADDGSGQRRWTIVNTILGPADVPYLATPEPFTYNNRTWVYMTLSPVKQASDISTPTDLAITGIDPAVPSFRRLTDRNSPRRLRQDPEYYITSAGPFLYYTRAIPATDTSGPVNEGVFRIDLGLGPQAR